MGNSDEHPRFRTGLCGPVEAADDVPIREVPLTVFAASLRVIAEEYAPGSAVPVPRERLLELLELVAETPARTVRSPPMGPERR